MARTLTVIDADGHVLEPADRWLNYIDPKLRNRAPRLFADKDGNELVMAGDQALTKPGAGGEGEGSRPFVLGGVSLQGLVDMSERSYAEVERGGYDPHARIKDMDADGIDAALALLADYVGSDHIVWAGDYPHMDGFTHGPDPIRSMGLSKQNEANVVSGGAKRLYGLN